MIKLDITMSLDGYVAGPDQTLDEPLGRGGESLHEWMFATDVWQREHGRDGGERSASSAVLEARTENVGAYVMGRKMFGGGPGPWNEDEEWRGWWGENPPYHVPVYVLTHHRREPLEMDGGTTFHFVTDGIASAMAQATEAAGGGDVMVAGGAEAARQYIAARTLDEIHLHISPVVLGGGESLFEGLEPEIRLEQIESVEAPGVLHVKYRLR